MRLFEALCAIFPNAAAPRGSAGPRGAHDYPTWAEVTERIGALLLVALMAALAAEAALRIAGE